MASIGDTTRPEYIYDQATDTWIPVGIGPHSHTPAAIGAISSSVVTTKGDLIVGTGSGTVVRQGVGADGSMLVADSSQTDGLNYALGNAYAAGKNKIINGDFRFNQRSFTSITTNQAYGFDRWKLIAGSGCTYSAQTFTIGTAPVAGYEGINFARLVTTGQSGSGVYSTLTQVIEDVRTFAGQTVTVSFWAKAASGTPKIAADIAQVFGSGGSSEVNTAAGAVTISTSWTRYSLTANVPSVSGKTLTADNGLGILLWVSAGTDFATRASSIGIQTNTFDIWGVQLEAGSVATPFTTATGTIQGELAACQRYYWRNSGSSIYSIYGYGNAYSTVQGEFLINFPVGMRVAPTSIEYANLSFVLPGTGVTAITSITVDTNTTTPYSTGLVGNVAAGLTTYRPYFLGNNNSSSGYVGFSAEL